LAHLHGWWLLPRSHCPFTDNTANATHNQQDNVIHHLNVGLIYWRHTLDWLGYERDRIKQSNHDKEKNQGDSKDHNAPDPDLDFFSC
jgi:hypothetical protein